jgi:hypothetical protein
MDVPGGQSVTPHRLRNAGWLPTSYPGMKTPLPARAEHYRPARARELREKAHRLEWWGGPGAALLFLSFLLGG